MIVYIIMSRILYYIEYRTLMNRNTVIAFFLFFLGLVVGQTYQLEFDWKLNTVSSDI